MPPNRRQRAYFLLGYARARRELTRELREVADAFDDELSDLQDEVQELRAEAHRLRVLETAAAADDDECAEHVLH
jgi:hypothetical protein